MDEDEANTEISRRTVIESGTTALLLTTLPRAALGAGPLDDAGPPLPSVTMELQINGRSHSLTLDPRRCAAYPNIVAAIKQAAEMPT
jgi:xanthine dehydrogenase YagT iron-sulfur-binding subunit